MPAIDVFCERCGARQPTEPTPANVGIAKRLANAVGLTADGVAQRQVDMFLRLCLECRGYSCPSCWNEGEGACQTCAPLPVVELAPAQLPGMDVSMPESIVADKAVNSTAPAAEPQPAAAELGVTPTMEADARAAATSAEPPSQLEAVELKPLAPPLEPLPPLSDLPSLAEPAALRQPVAPAEPGAPPRPATPPARPAQPAPAARPAQPTPVKPSTPVRPRPSAAKPVVPSNPPMAKPAAPPMPVSRQVPPPATVVPPPAVRPPLAPMPSGSSMPLAAAASPVAGDPVKPATAVPPRPRPAVGFDSTAPVPTSVFAVPSQVAAPPPAAIPAQRPYLPVPHRSAQPAPAGVKPCRSCHLQLSARAHFCRRCGTRQES